MNNLKYIVKLITMSEAAPHLYTLKTIQFDQIKDEDIQQDDCTTLRNLFWKPDRNLVQKLIKYFCITSPNQKVIDVGCGVGYAIFPKATHILGLDNETVPHNVTKINMDLDFDTFTQPDKYFDLVYCRHTFEDIQNPQNAFRECVRVGKFGYIETPSPLIEITKGAEIGSKYRGYIHHRYIVWSDTKTNTLYFLPKYPLLELGVLSDSINKRFHYLLNNYSVYWNNYYIWDSKNAPNIFVYRNGVNFDVRKDYDRLLNDAIFASIDYTNRLIPHLAGL